jgi:methyl-accepting chemotaxis protein
MHNLLALIQRPRLQLRWKLLGGFLVASLLLLVALVVAVLTLFSTTTTLDTLKVSNERSQLVLQMQVLENQLIARAMDYVWSDNLSRLNEYEVLHSSLERAVNSFQPNRLQQENYNTLKQELSSLYTLLEQMVKLDSTNKEDDAQQLWREQGSKQAAKVQTILDDLNDQENHNAIETYAQGESSTTSTAWLISLLAGVAMLVAVGLAFLLTAALVEPVRQLRTRLSKLAQGDLTEPVQIVNRDELGELGQTYNATLSSLHQLISQLYVQSQQVNSATEELAFQARNQVAGSSQQAEAIKEATMTLQELNQTAQQIAQEVLKALEAIGRSLAQTHSVNRLADETVQAHEEGREMVARTVRALQNLKEQIASIEEEQQALVEQSTAIGGIVELIDNIAKETHLLALNAAIEARGAGIYGERFAIIAGEVKRLADRAAGATQQVREALGGISQAVAKVSNKAEKGLSEAEQAVREARASDGVLQNMAGLTFQVKRALQEIVSQVEDTSHLASNIGIATKQQQSASSLLLEKMVEIEVVTTQNLSSVKQGEVVTYQLNVSAQLLEQSANAFKLVVAA